MRKKLLQGTIKPSRNLEFSGIVFWVFSSWVSVFHRHDFVRKCPNDMPDNSRNTSAYVLTTRGPLGLVRMYKIYVCTIVRSKTHESFFRRSQFRVDFFALQLLFSASTTPPGEAFTISSCSPTHSQSTLPDLFTSCFHSCGCSCRFLGQVLTLTRFFSVGFLWKINDPSLRGSLGRMFVSRSSRSRTLIAF